MRAFVEKYQRSVEGIKNPASIIYHYQPNGGKGSALNTGINLAHGEIILTFDADSVVHKDAIQHFVSYFADPEVMAAAGNIMIGNTKTLLGFIQSIEYFIGFQIKKAEALLGLVFVIGGAASAFRKEVFTQLGGYGHRHADGRYGSLTLTTHPESRNANRVCTRSHPSYRRANKPERITLATLTLEAWTH